MQRYLRQVGEKQAQVRRILDGNFTKRDLLRSSSHGNQRRAIRFLWVNRIDFFANAPVTFRTRTTDVREIAGRSVKILQARNIFGTVIGFDGESFVGLPD